MAHERLEHDAAYMMARHLIEVIAPCLREEEKIDAFREFYHVCRAGIEAYEIQVNRMRQRLKPLSN
jgi:hypothetical protein